MLTKADIRGAYAFHPTPCKEGGEHWSNTDSVDHEEGARIIESMIQAGIGGMGLCGTVGEGAALLWEEKQGYIDTAVQVTRGRVPVIAGATAFGTKEVVRQMRGLKDVGADAALVALPLWQAPGLENSVQFYADLSEAVPDMPIMVYANPRFFKSSYPVAFWEGIARKAPTVIACKLVLDPGTLPDKVRAAGHQVAFQPDEKTAYPAYQMVGDHITGLWTVTSGMGPEPTVALIDAILSGDEERMKAVHQDIESARFDQPAQSDEVPPPNYTAQNLKNASNASGYGKFGSARAPYNLAPAEWVEAAKRYGKAWAEMRKKYIKAAV